MATAAQKNNLETFRQWAHGTWLAHVDDNTIKQLVVDSRRIDNPGIAVFIAIKTSLRDGHIFLPDAYEKGVRNFIVSQDVAIEKYPLANIIKVADTLKAMQQIVTAHRKQFDIPVIGITGSNGKTIVKEWLYQLLGDKYNIVRSPQSYNSQIGVPLSVWQMEDGNEMGIFEAGISQPAEMEELEKIIRPTIGVFTNIGEAHAEGFLNLRQKINEKLVLFRHAGQLVYCRDHPELNECIAQYVHQLKATGEAALKLFAWSQRTDADLRIIKQNAEHGKTIIEATYEGRQISITIPFTDYASVENAIHCWCVALLLGLDDAYIQAHMAALQPVSMRLELRSGINDCTIINDTYNSDITSLRIALDYLDQQAQHKHHTVILSDILQVGKPDTELYEEVAALVSRKNIQRFVGIGPALYKNKAAFRKNKKLRSIFFKNTDEFIKKFHLITFNNEAILLKGARVFTFEKIDMLLEQKVHRTVMSINLSALTHNLNVFRGHIKPGVKTMAMVKAFSYGSGSYEIAHLLQFSGVDYLAVAYTDEGVELRKAGITMPIMVMSPDDESFDRMIAWKLEPEIFNFRTLAAFTEIAKTLQVEKYAVHIKLDTGMHRLGFLPGEMKELGTAIVANTHVHVASIFSHLAASEDAAQDDFTLQQAALFRQMSSELVEHLSYEPILHLCNSAGIARHPELHFDMVRLGLGLYGIESSGILNDRLKQISTLKTTIAQIKNIPTGDSIGYNRRAMAVQPMRIAVVSIGYADGYHRSLGNGKAHVLIHGQPAKVVGTVCMDMVMVDVTHIAGAKEGDEVIIFGPMLPVVKLAEWAGTIPYEIMTGISQRVKRVYVNEE